MAELEGVDSVLDGWGDFDLEIEEDVAPPKPGPSTTPAARAVGPAQHHQQVAASPSGSDSPEWPDSPVSGSSTTAPKEAAAAGSVRSHAEPAPTVPPPAAIIPKALPGARQHPVAAASATAKPNEKLAVQPSMATAAVATRIAFPSSLVPQATALGQPAAALAATPSTMEGAGLPDTTRAPGHSSTLSGALAATGAPAPPVLPHLQAAVASSLAGGLQPPAGPTAGRAIGAAPPPSIHAPPTHPHAAPGTAHAPGKTADAAHSPALGQHLLSTPMAHSIPAHGERAGAPHPVVRQEAPVVLPGTLAHDTGPRSAPAPGDSGTARPQLHRVSVTFSPSALEGEERHSAFPPTPYATTREEAAALKSPSRHGPLHLPDPVEGPDNSAADEGGRQAEAPASILRHAADAATGVHTAAAPSEWGHAALAPPRSAPGPGDSGKARPLPFKRVSVTFAAAADDEDGHSAFPPTPYATTREEAAAIKSPGRHGPLHLPDPLQSPEDSGSDQELQPKSGGRAPAAITRQQAPASAAAASPAPPSDMDHAPPVPPRSAPGPGDSGKARPLPFKRVSVTFAPTALEGPEQHSAFPPTPYASSKKEAAALKSPGRHGPLHLPDFEAAPVDSETSSSETEGQPGPGRAAGLEVAQTAALRAAAAAAVPALQVPGASLAALQLGHTHSGNVSASSSAPGTPRSRLASRSTPPPPLVLPPEAVASTAASALPITYLSPGARSEGGNTPPGGAAALQPRQSAGGLLMGSGSSGAAEPIAPAALPAGLHAPAPDEDGGPPPAQTAPIGPPPAQLHLDQEPPALTPPKAPPPHPATAAAPPVPRPPLPHPHAPPGSDVPAAPMPHHTHRFAAGRPAVGHTPMHGSVSTVPVASQRSRLSVSFSLPSDDDDDDGPEDSIAEGAADAARRRPAMSDTGTMQRPLGALVPPPSPPAQALVPVPAALPEPLGALAAAEPAAAALQVGAFAQRPMVGSLTAASPFMVVKPAAGEPSAAVAGADANDGRLAAGALAHLLSGLTESGSVDTPSSEHSDDTGSPAGVQGGPLGAKGRSLASRLALTSFASSGGINESGSVTASELAAFDHAYEELLQAAQGQESPQVPTPPPEHPGGFIVAAKNPFADDGNESDDPFASMGVAASPPASFSAGKSTDAPFGAAPPMQPAPQPPTTATAFGTAPYQAFAAQAEPAAAATVAGAANLSALFGAPSPRGTDEWGAAIAADSNGTATAFRQASGALFGSQSLHSHSASGALDALRLDDIHTSSELSFGYAASPGRPGGISPGGGATTTVPSVGGAADGLDARNSSSGFVIGTGAGAAMEDAGSISALFGGPDDPHDDLFGSIGAAADGGMAPPAAAAASALPAPYGDAAAQQQYAYAQGWQQPQEQAPQQHYGYAQGWQQPQEQAPQQQYGYTQGWQQQQQQPPYAYAQPSAYGSQALQGWEQQQSWQQADQQQQQAAPAHPSSGYSAPQPQPYSAAATAPAPPTVQHAAVAAAGAFGTGEDAASFFDELGADEAPFQGGAATAAAAAASPATAFDAPPSAAAPALGHGAYAHTPQQPQQPSAGAPAMQAAPYPSTSTSAPAVAMPEQRATLALAPAAAAAAFPTLASGPFGDDGSSFFNEPDEDGGPAGSWLQPAEVHAAGPVSAESVGSPTPTPAPPQAQVQQPPAHADAAAEQHVAMAAADIHLEPPLPPQPVPTHAPAAEPPQHLQQVSWQQHEQLAQGQTAAMYGQPSGSQSQGGACAAPGLPPQGTLGAASGVAATAAGFEAAFGAGDDGTSFFDMAGEDDAGPLALVLEPGPAVPLQPLPAAAAAPSQQPAGQQPVGEVPQEEQHHPQAPRSPPLVAVQPTASAPEATALAPPPLAPVLATAPAQPPAPAPHAAASEPHHAPPAAPSPGEQHHAAPAAAAPLQQPPPLPLQEHEPAMAPVPAPFLVSNTADNAGSFFDEIGDQDQGPVASDGSSAPPMAPVAQHWPQAQDLAQQKQETHLGGLASTQGPPVGGVLAPETAGQQQPQQQDAASAGPGSAFADHGAQGAALDSIYGAYGAAAGQQAPPEPAAPAAVQAEQAAPADATAALQQVEALQPAVAAPAAPVTNANGYTLEQWQEYYTQQYGYMYQHATGQGYGETDAVTYAQYYAHLYTVSACGEVPSAAPAADAAEPAAAPVPTAAADAQMAAQQSAVPAEGSEEAALAVQQQQGTSAAPQYGQYAPQQGGSTTSVWEQQQQQVSSTQAAAAATAAPAYSMSVQLPGEQPPHAAAAAAGHWAPQAAQPQQPPAATVWSPAPFASSASATQPNAWQGYGQQQQQPQQPAPAAATAWQPPQLQQQQPAAAASVAVTAFNPYMPATASSGFSYLQPTPPAATYNAWQQQPAAQQHPSHQHHALAALPTTQDVAVQCPHGRPAHTVMQLAFGGRVLLMRPPAASGLAASGLFGAPGPIQLVPLAVLSAQHLQPAAAADPHHGAAAGGRKSSKQTAPPIFEPVINTLVAFAGPLGPQTNKDKLLKYLTDRAAAAVIPAYADAQPQPTGAGKGHDGGVVATVAELAPSASSDTAELLRTLWGVLRLLVKHSDAAKARAKGTAKDESLESELLRLLLPQYHPPPAAAGGKGSRSGSHDGAAAAATGDGYVDSPQDTSGPPQPPVLALGAPPAQGGEAAQQAAAQRMQRYLIQGRKQDALRAAVEGGLWGPALLLATGLGTDGKAFQETATAMVQAQLLQGTPARTVALFLAGRPDLVHQRSGAGAYTPPPPPGTPSTADAAAPGPFGAAMPLGAPTGSSFSAASPHAPPPGCFNPYAAPAAVAGRFSGSGGPGVGGAASAAAAAAGDGMLAQWREHLAVMLSNRCAGDQEAVIALGDRLKVDAKSVLAAHVCYCLASLPPSLPDAPESRYTLLGVDAAVEPRAAATAAACAAVHRTEVLEWVMTRAVAAAAAAGGGVAAAAAVEALQLQMAVLLPYKLLHAAELAELGRLQEALQYCAAVDGALRAAKAAAAAAGAAKAAVGGPAVVPGAASRGGLPPGGWLAAAESLVAKLQDQIQRYAESHSINVAAGRSESAITKVGRFFDSTVNKLLWGGDGTAASQAAQAAGADAASAGAGGAGAGAAKAAVQVVYGGDGVASQPLQLAAAQPPPQAAGHAQADQPVAPALAAAVAVAGQPAAFQAAATPFGGMVPHVPSSGYLQQMSSFASATDSMMGAVSPGAGALGPMASGGSVLQPQASFGSVGSSMYGGQPPAAPKSVPGGTPLPQLMLMQQGSVHRRTVSAADAQQSGGSSGGGAVAAAAQQQYDAAAGVNGAAAAAQIRGTASELGHMPAKHHPPLPPHSHPGGVEPPSGNAGKAKGAGAKGDGGKGGGKGSWFPPLPINPLKGLLGAAGRKAGDGKPAPKEGNLGEENQFYYDEKRKRWVLKGQEDAAADEGPPPAPPTSLGWATPTPAPSMQAPASGGGGSGGGAAGAAGPGSFTSLGQPPAASSSFSAGGSAASLAPPSNGPGPVPGPAQGPAPGASFSRGRDLRSRYVDTINPGRSAPAGAAAAASSMAMLLPASSTGSAASFTAGAPAPHFFRPPPHEPYVPPPPDEEPQQSSQDEQQQQQQAAPPGQQQPSLPPSQQEQPQYQFPPVLQQQQQSFSAPYAQHHAAAMPERPEPPPPQPLQQQQVPQGAAAPVPGPGSLVQVSNMAPPPVALRPPSAATGTPPPWQLPPPPPPHAPVAAAVASAGPSLAGWVRPQQHSSFAPPGPLQASQPAAAPQPTPHQQASFPPPPSSQPAAYYSADSATWGSAAVPHRAANLGQAQDAGTGVAAGVDPAAAGTLVDDLLASNGNAHLGGGTFLSEWEYSALPAPASSNGGAHGSGGAGAHAPTAAPTQYTYDAYGSYGYGDATAAAAQGYGAVSWGASGAGGYVSAGGAGPFGGSTGVGVGAVGAGGAGADGEDMREIEL